MRALWGWKERADVFSPEDRSCPSPASGTAHPRKEVRQLLDPQGRARLGGCEAGPVSLGDGRRRRPSTKPETVGVPTRPSVAPETFQFRAKIDDVGRGVLMGSVERDPVRHAERGAIILRLRPCPCERDRKLLRLRRTSQGGV